MCEGVIRQTGSQHSLRDGGGRGPVRPGRSSHTCSLPSASPDLRPSSALVVSSKIHVKPNTYTEYIKHRVASGLRADETGGKTSTCCSKKEKETSALKDGDMKQQLRQRLTEAVSSKYRLVCASQSHIQHSAAV